MKTNIVIYISPQSLIWQKCGSRVIGFFKMQYLDKKVSNEVYYWHADKHQKFSTS